MAHDWKPAHRRGGQWFALASAVIALSPIASIAQESFWKTPTGPHGGAVVDLVRQPDGDLFTAMQQLGGNNPVYRSRDGGYSWQPLPQSAARLAAPSNSEVYALGSTSLERSRDDGDTWSHLDAPATPYGVVSTSTGRLLLATANGIYRSDDNGVSWQPSGAIGTSVKVIVTDGSGAVFAGADVELLESVDGGANWEAITELPSPITALARGPDGTWWIGTFGGYFNQLLSGVFAYDGINPPDAQLSANVVSIVVRHDGTVFALTPAFCTFETYGQILRSAGVGSEWASTGFIGNITAMVGGEYDGIYAGRGWSCGHISPYPGDGIWSTSGPGTHWTSRSRGLAHATSAALATAPGIVYAQTGSHLGWSTDRGVTWEVGAAYVDVVGLSIAAHPSGDVFATSTAWVAKNENQPAHGGVTLRSHDRGTTWEPYFVPDGHPEAQIVVTPAGTLLVGAYTYPSYNGVGRSTDRGDTWSIETEGAPGLPFSALKAGSISRVFAATSDATFLSEDDGQSWVSIGDVGGTELAVAVDETAVYIAAAGEPVQELTEQSPGNWVVRALPLGRFGPMAVDPQGTLYVASTTVSRLRRGDTLWHDIPGTPTLGSNSIYAPGRQSILLDDAGFLYVGTPGNGVLRSRLPLLDPTDVTLETTIAWDAGPNPVRGRTAFGLQLVQGQTVSLVMYDVRGRAVSTLWGGVPLGAGRHVAQWQPGPQVASGTYFYWLNVGRTARTGRVTLLR
jgi:hypothetical protein